MSMTYRVLRKGDASDRGPNGEYGFCVVGKDSETGYETAETIHCPESHVHGPSCVKTQMNQKTITGKDKDGKDIREGLTPKQMILKNVEGFKDKLNIPTGKAVFPTKKVKDPKTGKTSEVEDLDVTL